MKHKTSPCLLPLACLALACGNASAATVTIDTAAGTGFDGALIEVNYSGVYDGGFDTGSFRNNVYQAATRHLMTVLKFDLSSLGLSGSELTDATLTLTNNSASGNSRTRTLAYFTGDDSSITAGIGYNAANPFIDDAYVGETDTDTDFAAGTMTTILTFGNPGSGAGFEGVATVVGAGDANLLAALQGALNDDDTITFVIYGGNTQYLPYSDDYTGSSGAAYFPTLTLTTVPEPSAAWLGCLGLIPLLRRRRV